MTEQYIASWLADQVSDSPGKFPPGYDFDSIVDELNFNFDDQVVTDQLNDLLTELLEAES